ncbi:hypothetical protein OIU77_013253 [Salix suchowensis]|uniref:Uncharacterized protein n=1 Tax=Salix suchowensis TaxID=1278906 RepID=A0ABQ8ZT72_9ROSI|nr:hypothetical protein OIU77_013253 [Salix suchowensis]
MCTGSSFLRLRFVLFCLLELKSRLMVVALSFCPVSLKVRRLSLRRMKSLMNQISCNSSSSNSTMQLLTSDAVIEVNIEVPVAFRAIPAEAIESTGAQILQQILGLMLPRFMAQLVKDYQAWASGDTSRQPLGTGEI